jgi:hypothetical protein
VPYVGLETDPNQLIMRVVNDNLRPPIPKHCPPPFAKLIADCWSPQAAKRPSFAQILTTLKEIKASGVVPGAPAKRGAAEVAAAAAAAAAKAEAMAKAEAEAALERGSSPLPQSSSSLAMPSAELDAREVVFGPPTGFGLTPDFVDCRWRGTALCARQWYPAAGSFSSVGARAPALSQLPAPVVAIVERFALLRHPNVQLFMGAVALRKPVGIIACVFEDAGRGTLAHVLASRSAALGGGSADSSASSLSSPSSADSDSSVAAAAAIFDWDTSTRLALDIACGLAFLHGARPPVYQPRLSAHSVWLDAGGRAKLAGVFDAELEALCGAPAARAPPSLAAPETISASVAAAHLSPSQGSTFNTLSATAAAAATDVFHLGTLMWEIFAGGNALSAACDSAAEGGAKQPPMTRIPPDVQALIRACWHEAPAQRPSLADVTARLEAFLKDGPSRVALGAQNARRYHKKRTVLAFRSTDAVAIQKKWGKSQGKDGCFVVTGDDNLELGHAADVYCIDAATFAATYERVGGADSHRYRKTGHIWASRSPHALAVRTQAGTVELAAAGDYLVQDDAGAQWAIQADAFDHLYEASP